MNITEALRKTMEAQKEYGARKYANVLKGFESGEIVALNDVSPLEHEMRVKISAKNLVPYRFGSGTQANRNGIAFTDNNNGSVTMQGTADASNSYDFTNNLILTAGTYTMSIAGDLKASGLSGTQLEYVVRNVDANTEITRIAIVDGVYPDSTNFTLSATTTVRLYIIYYVGVTFAGTLIPKLQNSTLNDLTAVTVSKLGKNLINASIFTKAGFADLGNGEFYTEYAKDVSQKVMFENISKISGSFYISGEWKHVLPEGALRGVYLTIYYVDGTTEDISMVQSTEYVSIVKQTPALKTVDCIRFISGSGMAGTYFKNIQIEHRDTATAYEEGIEPTTYSVNPDGTVEGITSLYPSTTLMTDTPGALIECEYNRDLNKAFEQITQAILSLGGNI